MTRNQVEADGVPTAVVSMPCWKRFAAQSPAYRESVLPAAVTARVSVEAGVSFGWETWIGPGSRGDRDTYQNVGEQRAVPALVFQRLNVPAVVNVVVFVALLDQVINLCAFGLRV